MRDLSRSLAAVGLACSLLPTAARAAPPELSDAAGEPTVPTGVEGPPVEGTADAADEPPLDTDEPPLDTDSDEPPLDTDDEPLDTDDEPLDTEVGPGFDDDDDDGPRDDYQVLRDSPEAKAARRWLGAGIAATSAGALLVGGAVAMGMTDPCDPDGGNNCFVDARDRAAVTMGVPGGVLLLGGVAMTVVGALQKRRLFFDYATPTVAVGRDHIGLGVVGRF